MSRTQLTQFIKQELDSELAGQSRRVVESASKGNRITSEKFGNSIFRYLDTIYWGRIVQYVSSRIEELDARLTSRLSSALEDVVARTDSAQSTAEGVSARIDALSNRINALSTELQDLKNSINNS
jgi:hypothetical protein